jgi:hypothetical protein
MADVTWVTAGIGGGKSLFAVRSGCRELRHGERMLVNNIPWEIDKLWDWCHEKIEKPVDLTRRLRVLVAEETIEFYRYFPPMVGDIEQQLRLRALGMVKVTKEQREEWFALAMKNIKAFESGKLPMEKITGHERPMLQLRQGDGGIYYQLDEVHLSFPARYWQEHGLAVEHYMSQLRKLNDDLMLITQHSGKVDKNFRRNGTEWIVLQNMSKVRLMGGVSLPGRFRYHQFAIEPTKGDKPQSSPWFNLDDEGYKNLYNTMSGVGLAGVMEKENSMKKKGRHWSVWVAGIAMIGLAGYFLPTLLTKAAGAGLGHALGNFGNAATSAVRKDDHKSATANPSINGFPAVPGGVAPDGASSAVAPPAVESSSSVGAPAVVSPVSSSTESVTNDEVIYCSGYTIAFGKVNVLLSDGRTAESQFGEVQWVHRDEVKVFDKVFPVRRKVLNGEYVENSGAFILPETPGVISSSSSPRMEVVKFGQPRLLGHPPAKTGGFGELSKTYTAGHP